MSATTTTATPANEEMLMGQAAGGYRNERWIALTTHAIRSQVRGHAGVGLDGLAICSRVHLASATTARGDHAGAEACVRERKVETDACSKTVGGLHDGALPAEVTKTFPELGRFRSSRVNVLLILGRLPGGIPMGPGSAMSTGTPAMPAQPSPNGV